ncbi:TRAP transporter small permease [Allosediminivita pacifica]|uniref:TRAP transporter small permease protein n=1 Tax=Allosediminivita pacifica TaxID=1267769 RepID=A0A2T6ATQ5_9RHOB|nr:TRAP transporter small permease [Allosediminivita pacifica]PTX47204.1 TRAP-type C4-dicarboxylate transport system permease small subunit [Allosediminivita pacifica]GGB09443.1 hypothetical protein GCM10011324_19350 [Allosediminivita pacifica]
MHTIRKATLWGDRLFMTGVILMMGVICATIIADVIARYIFSSAIIFSSELSRLGLIWLTFLVMPLGISRGMHVAITAVQDNVPPLLRTGMWALSTLFVIALMVVVLMGALTSIDARSYEQMNTLPLTAAWYFHPVALGAGWSLVHLVVQLVDGLRHGRDAATPGETMEPTS